MPARAALIVAALLAAGWLAMQAVGSVALADATALAFRAEPPSQAEAQRAQRRLDVAERLSPGVRPLLARGALALRAGGRRRAARHFRDAAEREPDNVEAWGLLARAAEGREAAAARARALTLAPPVPSP